MKVKTFTVNPFEMNCYVYYDPGSREGAIIDPGAYSDVEKTNIEKFVVDEGINIKYILNTHGHIDHILGNNWAKERFGAPLLMHNGDSELLKRSVEQGLMFGLSIPQSPEPDRFIEENEFIPLSETRLKVIHTPGHSPGGICFADEKEKLIFVGDCVFKGSIGRTDLWEGNLEILLNSINKKILSFSDDFLLYPGHFDSTTIGHEKTNNPFLNGSPGTLDII